MNLQEKYIQYQKLISENISSLVLEGPPFYLPIFYSPKRNALFHWSFQEEMQKISWHRQLGEQLLVVSGQETEPGLDLSSLLQELKFSRQIIRIEELQETALVPMLFKVNFNRINNLLGNVPFAQTINTFQIKDSVEPSLTEFAQACSKWLIESELLVQSISRLIRLKLLKNNFQNRLIDFLNSSLKDTSKCQKASMTQQLLQKGLNLFITCFQSKGSLWTLFLIVLKNPFSQSSVVSFLVCAIAKFLKNYKKSSKAQLINSQLEQLTKLISAQHDSMAQLASTIKALIDNLLLSTSVSEFLKVREVLQRVLQSQMSLKSSQFLSEQSIRRIQRQVQCERLKMRQVQVEGVDFIVTEEEYSKYFTHS